MEAERQVGTGHNPRTRRLSSGGIRRRPPSSASPGAKIGSRTSGQVLAERLRRQSPVSTNSPVDCVHMHASQTRPRRMVNHVCGNVCGAGAAVCFRGTRRYAESSIVSNIGASRYARKSVAAGGRGQIWKWGRFQRTPVRCPVNRTRISEPDQCAVAAC